MGHIYTSRVFICGYLGRIADDYPGLMTPQIGKVGTLRSTANECVWSQSRLRVFGVKTCSASSTHGNCSRAESLGRGTAGRRGSTSLPTAPRASPNRGVSNNRPVKSVPAQPGRPRNGVVSSSRQSIAARSPRSPRSPARLRSAAPPGGVTDAAPLPSGWSHNSVDSEPSQSGP